MDIHEESLAFQKNVRNIYLKVAQTDDRLAVVNCSNDDGSIMSPEKIFDLIIKTITRRKLI
jgi:thymidylate kinase